MAFPDITEKKQLEKKLIQSEKMESIGNLAGGIAHHFNNILSSILGFSEIALGDVEKGSNLEYDLKEIHTAGKRARDLVLQILSFARQNNEEVKPVSIANIVNESIKLLESTIPADIEIKQNISTEAMVMGNPALLQQVILDLSSNAADAMENKGGTLSLGVSDQIVDARYAAQNELAGPGKYVQLSIADTGTGIAPDIIKTIFEPYFTTKEPGKGTGMGLASAYGIVKKYGGNIHVESRLEQGSVFKILLPAIQKKEEGQ
jgi:signal transduction histidine kinase